MCVHSNLSAQKHYISNAHNDNEDSRKNNNNNNTKENESWDMTVICKCIMKTLNVLHKINYNFNHCDISGLMKELENRRSTSS